MRRLGVVLMFLIAPVALMAQGTVRVTSMYGPVELRSVSSQKFVPLAATTQMVQVGDEIRTGFGGNVILEVPDGSYLVVSENTSLTVQDFWSGSVKNMVQLMMGRVRFYIQKFGGKPNPYRVQTPTALIAVRGTTFDVVVEPGQATEVRCIEGRVAVESAGLSDREVILEAGRKTLVRPGEYPLMPVPLDEAIAGSRVIRVVRKDAPGLDSGKPGDIPASMIARDGDRRHRISDPLQGPNSRINGTEIQRAKPGLKYPDNN